MDLFDAVLRIIAEFSDSCVTLVSKAMRDGYFRKNGIWIRQNLEAVPFTNFPKKFHEYKINIDYLLSKYDDIPTLRNSLDSLLMGIYLNYNQDLLDHIIRNATYIKVTNVEFLELLPNIQRIDIIPNFYCSDLIGAAIILHRKNITGAKLHLDQWEKLSQICEIMGDLEFYIDHNRINRTYSEEENKLVRNRIRYGASSELLNQCNPCQDR